MLGFLVGAIIYGVTYQSIFPAISAIANLGSVTFPGLLDIDLWLTILLFSLMSVTLFYFLERHGELRKEPTEPELPVDLGSDLAATSADASPSAE
jgi:hypothetical protein